MKAASLYSSFPYAALGILIVGLLVRYFMALRKPETISAKAREALELLAGGRLWQGSLALLFAFHLFGLLFPRFILNWNAGRAGLYSASLGLNLGSDDIDSLFHVAAGGKA